MRVCYQQPKAIDRIVYENGNKNLFSSIKFSLFKRVVYEGHYRATKLAKAFKVWCPERISFENVGLFYFLYPIFAQNSCSWKLKEVQKVYTGSCSSFQLLHWGLLLPRIGHG